MTTTGATAVLPVTPQLQGSRPTAVVPPARLPLKSPVRLVPKLIHLSLLEFEAIHSPAAKPVQDPAASLQKLEADFKSLSGSNSSFQRNLSGTYQGPKFRQLPVAKLGQELIPAEKNTLEALYLAIPLAKSFAERDVAVNRCRQCIAGLSTTPNNKSILNEMLFQSIEADCAMVRNGRVTQAALTLNDEDLTNRRTRTSVDEYLSNFPSLKDNQELRERIRNAYLNSRSPAELKDALSLQKIFPSGTPYNFYTGSGLNGSEDMLAFFQDCYIEDAANLGKQFI